MVHSGFVRLSAVALTFLLIAGCAPRFGESGGQSSSSSGSQAAQAPSQPKRIVAAIRGDPRTLNGAISSTAGGSSVAGVPEIELLLTAGLAVMDERSQLIPHLAET